MCSKSSLLIDPDELAFAFLTWGEARRGETTRCKVRLRGELRACIFLTGVGDVTGMADVRSEVFFLMERGSMGVATEIDALLLALGVDSKLPVGNNGCRLLLVIPER